jgi:hypothetical protein
MTTIQLELPDEMAETIRQEGLLTPEGLREMPRDALRSKALAFINDFVAENKRLGAVPMTTEEIQAEIDAMRAEKACQ